MKTKPNKENSSIKQALLDLKASGGYAEHIDSLIRQIEDDSDLLKNADKLFKKHLYPESALNWLKLHSDIEFARFLSPNALMVLIAMCQNMRHGNLLQVNYRKLIQITHLSSLKIVKPALIELQEQGCITIKIAGHTRRSTVYMINPEIATVGKDVPGLIYRYWQIVRENDIAAERYVEKKRLPQKQQQNEESSSDKLPDSATRDTWVSLTKERTYSKGIGKLEVGSQEIYFSKIEEPKIKKKKTANEDSTKNNTQNTDTANTTAQDAAYKNKTTKKKEKSAKDNSNETATKHTTSQSSANKNKKPAAKEDLEKDIIQKTDADDTTPQKSVYKNNIIPFKNMAEAKRKKAAGANAYLQDNEDSDLPF